MAQPKSIAQTLWPHLPTERVEQPRRQSTSSLSEAMYPSQTPRAKAEAERHKQFVRDLRELRKQIERSR